MKTPKKSTAKVLKTPRAETDGAQHNSCKVKKGLCKIRTCNSCYLRSFASYHDHRKVAMFSADNNMEPWQLSLKDNNKFLFDCSECNHTFSSKLNHVANGAWCPYCSGRNICSLKGCEHCTPRSFAAFSNLEKVAMWSIQNIESPWQVAMKSGKKFAFDCTVCDHTFWASLDNVVCHGTWCPFCSGRSICDEQGCSFCTPKSFVNFHDEKKLAMWSTQNEQKPRQVSISSSKEFKFDCTTCDHTFSVHLHSLTAGQWCSFCSGRKICGKDECEWCKAPCVICKQSNMMYVGQRTTSEGMMCLACYAISPYATATTRAKISLEIHFIMALELACTAENHNWDAPTSWDCAVLPCLSYKPDLLYVFDADNMMVTNTGSRKLSDDTIDHVIILEVLEVGTRQHSDARSTPDHVREKEIRDIFGKIPVHFLYVTVAAYNHQSAAEEDKFFAKGCVTDPKEKAQKFEYSVVQHKKKSWNIRIRQVVDALEAAHDVRSNATQWIGN